VPRTRLKGRTCLRESAGQTDAVPDADAVFPPGFFDRSDPTPDPAFYSWPRLVTHIDDGAVAAVGDLYRELRIDGDVLDLMGSWVSHFHETPRHLTVLGMNAEELSANPQGAATVLHDLNADPVLPFEPGSFDAAVCCVSVDYLTRPVEVFAEVARVLRPAAPFVCTFSNRCFPTKAIRGWLESTDEQHCTIVAAYFRLAGGFDDPVAQRRTPSGRRGDPLFAVWATRRR
jgi:Methyltransferase domain